MAEAEPLGLEREPTWDQKVVRLNAALAERHIPYAFGGAIAFNYHRERRSTLDIDVNIFLSPEHEETVLGALGGVYDLADSERVGRELRRDGQARSSWGATYVDLSWPTPTSTRRWPSGSSGSRSAMRRSRCSPSRIC